MYSGPAPRGDARFSGSHPRVLEAPREGQTKLDAVDLVLRTLLYHEKCMNRVIERLKAATRLEVAERLEALIELS